MTISSIFESNGPLITSGGSSEETVGDTWTDTVNEVTVPRPVLNFTVSNLFTAFRAIIVVNVHATQNISETFDLLGTFDGTNWAMSQNSAQSLGNNTNVVFSIDTSGTVGQIKYTSTPAVSGFNERVFKWLIKTF